MENDHLSHSANSSEDVWLPRSSCPVTSSDSERNHNISEFGLRTNLDETSSHLEKANSIPRSLRSFLRKAASLKESCSVSSTKCSVFCLDGRCLRFNVHKLALGRQLLDTVCQYLEIEESQYFGLVFYLNRKADRNSVLGTCQNEESSSGNNQDGLDKSFRISSSSSSINNSYSTRFCGCPLTNSFNPCKVYSYHSTYPGFNPFFIDVPFWLDTEKRITDQCHGNKLIFYFQVKFYPQHPDRVFQCPKSRHQFCLQLRQHLCIGRLLCSFETHVILGALIAQMVLGDAIKYQRSHSAHLSCRSIHCAESTSHAYSRQQSTSLTHSLSSAERGCSLAEPEHSDSSIIWDSQKDGKSNEVKYHHHHPSSSVNKRNTFSHIGCSCSTQQIDNTSMIYLQCLPHLARGSVTSSSIIHQSTYDITSNSRPSLSSTAMFSNIEDVLLSPLANNFSPGWPYPKSNCQYCPVLLSRITRLHRKFRGMLQEDAEKSFLENVKKLAFYGVELHPVKKFHATYMSTGSFKKLTKKLVRSFSDRSKTSPTESYHNYTDEYLMNGSNQTLNSSSKGNKSLSKSSIKSSLQRLFNIKRGSALFPFAFNDFPNFDFSLGVYHAGVFLQWGHLRLSHYTWSQIVKVCYHSDEFSIVVRDNKIKSSPTRRILLTCKFACRKLAKRFYRTCVEHHIFFKMHQNRSFLSNTIKEQLLKPQSLILPIRQNLRIGDESNPSVSINGPCSIEYLSVSNLQSPKLPTTPTRSESEIAEFITSSNNEVNHDLPTQSIHHSQVDTQPQMNLYTIEKTYSTEHLVPSTSYAAPSARNAACFQLDTDLGNHITSSPLKCSSRVNILNVTAEDDDHYRSPEIQFYECMHISEGLNLNPEDDVHQSTPTPANTQLSFSLEDDAVNDSLLMPPENSNFESSSNEVCETLLNCRISNLQSADIDSLNCDSCLPTGVGHCLPALQNVSACTPSSQITAENSIDPLWFNVYPSIDFKLLDRIISPTYRSIISPNGQIIRLTSGNDSNHVQPSTSSTLPCSFLHLNSNDKEATSYFPIPIVQTRAVRFVYDPSLQINEYKTFSSNSQIHLVCANDIPLVSTKFFYHH